MPAGALGQGVITDKMIPKVSNIILKISVFLFLLQNKFLMTSLSFFKYIASIFFVLFRLNSNWFYAFVWLLSLRYKIDFLKLNLFEFSL